MSETKNEAFHRLAGKRIETIEDALRIFSNLSGPSYEWSPEEVNAYFERIDTAAKGALERFTETKRWGLPAPAPAETDPLPELPDNAPEPPPAAPTGPGITARQAEMLRIWDEASNEDGALLEMLAMQREVIKDLQSRLDQQRAVAA